ncbi:hypothetical protein SK128_022594 [Halocaridina rubra]|uniref:Fibronectin type-III domain-containing protein n=1 Tax=Halocaridina rubra TaxID=373956 RepID=A0AAN8WXF5_HALRR
MFERVNGVFGCRTRNKYPVHTFEHHFKHLSVEPRSTNQCAKHDFSECVVNADSQDYCTCLIDLSLEDCRIDPGMLITLNKESNATDPSERLITYEVSERAKHECHEGPRCPYTGDGVTGAFKDCCYWNTDQGYLPHDPTMGMIFVVKNTLVQTDVEFWKPIDYLGIVIPNPAENLSAVASMSNMVTVQWSTPESLISFPGDLLYRVVHRINSTYDKNTSWSEPIYGRCANKTCTMAFEARYPGMHYDIQVRLRSGAANNTLENDGWWSNETAQVIMTLPTRPRAAPSVEPGTFQFHLRPKSGEKADLVVAWQRMDYTQFSGPDFHYVIRVSFNGNETKERETGDLDALTIFTDMPINTAYDLEIWSANSEGHSTESSILHVPASEERPSPPVLPAVIYHNDEDLYELQ